MRPYKITSIDLNSRHSRVLVDSGVLRLIDFDRGVSIPEDDQFLFFSAYLCQAEHVLIEFPGVSKFLTVIFAATSLSLDMLISFTCLRLEAAEILHDDAGSWGDQTHKLS